MAMTTDLELRGQGLIWLPGLGKPLLATIDWFTAFNNDFFLVKTFERKTNETYSKK